MGLMKPSCRKKTYPNERFQSIQRNLDINLLSLIRGKINIRVVDPSRNINPSLSVDHSSYFTRYCFHFETYEIEPQTPREEPELSSSKCSSPGVPLKDQHQLPKKQSEEETDPKEDNEEEGKVIDEDFSKKEEITTRGNGKSRHRRRNFNQGKIRGKYI